jgi:hypothetical protein
VYAKVFRLRGFDSCAAGSTIKLHIWRNEFAAGKNRPVMLRRSKYCTMLKTALERECRLA